jgi:TolB-like protein
VIQIPKGSYVPVFEARKPGALEAKADPARRRLWLVAGVCGAVLLGIVVIGWLARRDGASHVSQADIDRSVAVLPLQMFTEGGSRGYIAKQIGEVLTTELAKNKQLRVLSRTTASEYGETKSSLPTIARSLGVRWVVEGGVGLEGNRAYTKMRVVDAVTDRKIWADVVDCDLSEVVGVYTRVADKIAGAIVAEMGAGQR